MSEFRDEFKASREKLSQILAGDCERDWEKLILAATYARFLIECLCYRRLEIYRRQSGDEQFVGWQPAKVISFLVKIEPFSDHAASINALDGTFALTYNPFNLKKIQRNYHWLGSLLHVQSGRGIHRRSAWPSKSHRRLSLILDMVNDAFSHPIEHLAVKVVRRFNCLRCEAVVKYVARPSGENETVECEVCGSRYEIDHQGGKPDSFKVIEAIDLNCLNEGCGGAVIVWADEAILLRTWTCSQCGSFFRFVPVLKADITKGGP